MKKSTILGFGLLFLCFGTGSHADTAKKPAESGVQVGVNPMTGDFGISITGVAARRIFQSLQVESTPGLRTRVIVSDSKVGKNITVTKTSRFTGAGTTTEYSAHLVLDSKGEVYRAPQ